MKMGVPSTSDIDKIISNPQLFAMVSERIKKENNRGALPFAATPRLPFIRRHSFIFASATLVFIAVIVGAAGLLKSKNEDLAASAVKEVTIPAAKPEMARPEVPPDPFVGKLTAGRAPSREIQAEKAVLRTIVRSPGKVEKKIKQPAAVIEPEGKFYSLSTGDETEPMPGARIVRVNIPKSSLFAMGVNIPLENGPEAIKADLLIGSDGSTRAIRFAR